MAISLSTTAAAINLSLKLRNNNYYCGIQEMPSSTVLHSSFPPDKKKKKKKKYNKRFPFVSLVSKEHQAITQILNERKRNEGKSSPPRKGARRVPFSSEGTEEDEDYAHICPGCGVFLQDKDPNRPGYYQKRKAIASSAERDALVADSDQEGGDAEKDQFEEPEPDDDGGGLREDDEEDFGRDSIMLGNVEEMDEKGDKFNWDFDEFAAATLKDGSNLDLDGFAPAGVGYGNLTEEVMERERKKKEGRTVSKAEKKWIAREAAKKEKDEDVRVCARCHSLRNYGQVKNQAAENLIPDFDFDRLIATRLMKPTGNGNATVVVMVVDCVDFDGSFPKRATKSLFDALEAAKNDPRTSKKLPRLVLVATKVDLLPSQISPTRLDRWVRHRARAGGAPKLSGVYLVSARKDLGMKNLLSFIKELAGPRGNVWVIGAQNAGKSTLINAFAKKEGVKVTKLTEAPVPGTTLGILRIRGILSAKAKMYDTPGLLHPYLMSMRLNRDEQKMTEIRKELQPRTYRMKVGQAVHVGGLVRLDLNEASVETIYVTVWASPNVSLHLGKIENADDFWRNHVGVRLQPPVRNDRASELGKWEENEMKVTGASWDVNSIDVAVAGLGWFSLGLKGEATLKLWTYDGIEITTREPLVLDRAPFLERPGFWLPKAVSNAIGNQAALEAQKRKMLKESSLESLLEMPA